MIAAEVGDIAAVDAEGLAQGADEDMDALGVGVFLDAAARLADRADAVRIVDDHRGALGELVVVFSGDLGDLVQRARCRRAC